MLRRLSILSVCIILFITIFSQMVAAQDPNPVPRPARIYHIGIPQTLDDGQPNPAYQPNGTVNVNYNITNYYFDSLQTLRADTSGSYFSIQHEGLTNGSFELRLYSDQVIPNPSDTGEFYSIWSDFSPTTKNVLITSADGTPKKISTPDGELANADFLRIDSSDISGGTGGGEDIHVNLYITKDISIKAGSSTSSNRYATSIKGDRFHAEGVTYVDGGPIVVTNSGSPGSVYGDNDHHSAVYLKGATFDGNTASPTSNGAILSLSNIASADLKDTNFKNSDADWQVYVFMDDSAYRNTPNVTIQLGAAEEGTSSVLGEVNGRGGIKFAGNAPAGSYTVDVNGDGDFYQNQTIQTDNGNYSLTVNKNGLGTWYVADGLINTFAAQGQRTDLSINSGILEMGNSSKFELHGTDTTLNIDGNSTLNMGDTSKFELHGTDTTLNMDGNSTLNMGKNTLFEIHGTGDTNISIDDSTIKIGDDSLFDVQGSDIDFTMFSSTLELGKNAKYVARSSGGTNYAYISNSSNVNMGRGSQLIFTNNTNIPNGDVSLYAKTTLSGGNFIQAEDLSIASAVFNINADTLKYAYDQNKPVLTIEASSVDAGNTVFDIHGVHSNVNHLELVQNIGSGTFNANNYRALLDGEAFGGSTVSQYFRSSLGISVGNNGKSLFLDVQLNNKILKWEGLMNPYWRLEVGDSGNWRMEQYEPQPETAYQYLTSSFVHNDAVIFDDHVVNPPSGYNITIEPTQGIYLSQQNDWLTNVVDPDNGIYQQHFVTEYGMRISSEHDWTFSGGSINDDFSPNPAAAFQDQKKHVARLIFDGTGSLRLNNTDANKFHDGLLIGNNSTGIDAGPSQLRAARPDSLGSGEFAGEITDISIAKKDADGNIILKKNGTGNPILDASGNPTPEYEVRGNGNPVKYVVQHEGYGIMFVDNGAEIKIDGGNKSTDDVMDQRIVVRQGSIGSLIVTPPVDPDEKILETVVTASGSYWKNQANFAEEIKHGGVAVVEDNAAFTMTGNFHFKNNVFLDSPAALSPKANFDGGVIWAGENANVILDGNSYSENVVSRDGGVIWSGTGTNVSANNGTFTKNAAGENGGAVYFTGGLTPEEENAKLLVADSRFYNNKANLGGAVYINDSADVNLARSGFQFNGIGVQDDLDTDGNIIGEKADFSQIFTSKGGAVYINSNSNINIDGAAFNENGAVNGGAIFTAKTKITGIKSIFQGNIASQSGGALHVNGADAGVMTMSFSGAVFTDNEAGVHGGAVYLNPETVNDLILDFNRLQTPSTFINNLTHSVNSQGGAIYAGGTGITIRARDAKFEFNMAGRDGAGTGFRGGAVYMGNNDSLSAPQASFQGNRTNADGGQGGAIYSGYGAKISLTGATFGYADIGDPDVDGNLSPMIGNSASLHGGAIYTVGNSSVPLGLGELNIADTKFNVNGYKIIQQPTGTLPLPSGYAFVESYEGNDYFYVPETQKGGAIYSGLTAITGGNAVFSQNGAVLDGGALYIQDDNSADKVNSKAAAEIVLTNGQFDRNFAATGSGGAIYLDATGYRSVTAPADSFDEILNIDGSKFYSNEAKLDGGAVYAKSHTTINANSTGINNIRPTEFGSYIEDPDNISSLPVGNIAGRNGGAVFLDGEVIGFNGQSEATSKLKADGAIFQYNQAGGDGGAVYLHYADAEIPNARFYYNSAVNRGGAIFFENEDGKNLNVETNIFYQNQASFGGAVYAANKTIVHARGTQFYINTVSSDGGAFYFNADQSQLDASNAVFWSNDAQGSGGAVYMKDHSRFVSSDAEFFGNRAAIDGGAVRIGQLAEVMLNGAQFDNNTASYGNGGAVMIDDKRTMKYLDSLNILNVDNARFTANTAQGNGGAVYAPNTNISADGSTFESNAVSQDGGAIYAQDSDLIAKNAFFTGNTAIGKGGAVYFLTTNDLDRIIYLGASDNLRSSFSNNKSGTFADTLFNSIYFDAQSADEATNVKLNITTGKNGNLEMLDPLVVDSVNNNINLDIVKTGSGIWSLAGINDLTTTTVGTTVDINGGTFKLQSGGNLLLTNVDASDYINISAGGIFATAEPLTPNLIHRLNTTNLNFAGGSKMQLGGNLELNVASDYTISSSLSGNGALTKKDANVLNFRGNTINYNGNINIEAGELNIVKDSIIAGSGHFTTQGIFSMAPNTVLRVNADPAAPTIVAKSANIEHVNLYIGGISGEYDNNFYLIHTADGITGDFNSVNSIVGSLEEIDYLTYKLGFLNDHKDYGGTIGLRWYSNDDTLKARGQFTLTNAEDYFNVAVELHDTNTNLYPGDPNDPSYDPGWQTRWDGKSLDKLGLGTLELSRANTYSGKTTVYAGELLLSDKQATGLGNTAVEVKQDARLGFNFDGKYLKTINGEGQVVQHGGTVELSGTNNYSGGTVLKGGVMGFVTGKSFGTGTITFDGGTMRNKAETDLTQQMVVANGKNAKFETPVFEESTRSIFVNSSKTSLTVSSNISGNGGLEKTGEGILALTGKNTFTGPAYIQNGGLQIDGSVISDVRVQADAAVSGTGTVGGDLFIAKNGYFDWYFSPNQAASGPLNVGGSLYIAEGAVFRPRTDSTNFSDPIVGWTVLNYGKTFGGQFIGIDDTFNAFYNFELDYSVPGEVRVNGELLARPKPLSDIVTAGLYIADRKLYRTPFNELMRETVYRKSALTVNRSVRGQMIAQPTRSAWFAPIARENSFGSSYVGGDYDLHAYGAQTGSTLWSNGNSSLGFMIGYERGQLKNSLDWIRSHDYQLGLYFGHVYSSGYEFRGFIGGGFQTFTASRQVDWFQGYKTKYDGSSFEMNAEIGKFFAGQNGTLLRPYIAFDIEHAGQTAAQENRDGNAFRDYGRSDLSQFFFRFGADLEKRWQYNDINVGLSFSELIFGQTHAKAPIFYPVRDAGTTSYGARLGRASVTFKAGWNWYFNRKRTSSFTLDYYADLYLDRENHDTAQQTGSAGIQVRF